MFVVGQDEVVDALGQFVAGGELATAEQLLVRVEKNSSINQSWEESAVMSGFGLV